MGNHQMSNLVGHLDRNRQSTARRTHLNRERDDTRLNNVDVSAPE
jgi:hypothetical protein